MLAQVDVNAKQRSTWVAATVETEIIRYRMFDIIIPTYEITAFFYYDHRTRNVTHNKFIQVKYNLKIKRNFI